MSNIEEDIKILKQFNSLKINSYAFKFVDISYPKLQQAIDNILAEREQDKKRIKELEDYKNNRVDFQKKYIEVTNLYLDSIPKQKVKDKIEELKLSGGSNGKDNVENLAKELATEVLEELLEEK